MIVSVDKGQVVASQDKVAREVAMHLSSHRFQARRTVKQLGVDRRMVRGGRPVQTKRASRMKVRITRFRRLACAGRSISRLYRSGGIPAVTYGMRVHGVPDAQLASLRATAAFSIFGALRGRSRTIEYMLSDDPKSDPTYDANALPSSRG